MQAVTLTVAALGSLLVLGLRPVYGLCVYFAVLLGYSQRLTAPLGVFDFTTGRIVIIALVARALLSPSLRASFRFTGLDAWVIVSFLGVLAALSQTTPEEIFLIRESGTFVDTLLPYFAVRLIVRDRAVLLTMIKGLVVVAIPLALMGAVQSLTGKNPVGFMQEHYAWGMARAADAAMDTRYGFHRASVSFGHPIIFGLFFAAVLPLVLAMPRRRGGWGRTRKLLVAAVVAGGLLSSMSSAPLFALVIVAGFLVCFPLRRHWPVPAIGFVALMLFIEVYSNRNFYHVFTRLAFSGSNAYYRIGLWEEAWGGGMDGHWLAGYGYVGVGPGVDNTNFHWKHKDLVNIYIGRMARYGLLGLLPFLVVNVLIYRRLYQAAARARAPDDQWLIWCVAAAIVGWNVAFMTVSALEQVQVMLYMLFALSANLPRMMKAEAHAEGHEELVLVRRRRAPRAGLTLNPEGAK